MSENEDAPENYEWELEEAVYNSRINKEIKERTYEWTFMNYFAIY